MTDSVISGSWTVYDRVIKRVALDFGQVVVQVVDENADSPRLASVRRQGAGSSHRGLDLSQQVSSDDKRVMTTRQRETFGYKATALEARW